MYKCGSYAFFEVEKSSAIKLGRSRLIIAHYRKPWYNGLTAKKRGAPMRKCDIQVGACYSNGKGRVRKVLAMGPQYKYYRFAECSENLRYEVIQDGTKNNTRFGEMGNVSLSSFASWAKERVDDMPSCEFHPAIAYNDTSGKGFMDGLHLGSSFPFLEEGYSSVSEALVEVQKMREQSYRNVTLFAVPERQSLLPQDCIAWEFVFSRRIWIDEDAEHWNYQV